MPGALPITPSRLRWDERRREAGKSPGASGRGPSVGLAVGRWPRPPSGAASPPAAGHRGRRAAGAATVCGTSRRRARPPVARARTGGRASSDGRMASPSMTTRMARSMWCSMTTSTAGDSTSPSLMATSRRRAGGSRRASGVASWKYSTSVRAGSVTRLRWSARRRSSTISHAAPARAATCGAAVDLPTPDGPPISSTVHAGRSLAMAPAPSHDCRRRPTTESRGRRAPQSSLASPQHGGPEPALGMVSSIPCCADGPAATGRQGETAVLTPPVHFRHQVGILV